MVPEPPVPTSGDSSPKCGPADETNASLPVKQNPFSSWNRFTPQNRGHTLHSIMSSREFSTLDCSVPTSSALT